MEAVVITVLLSVHTLMGLMQQRRSMMAMDLLKQRLSVLARVKRGGRSQQIEASQLVPGDAIHLRVGDIVPADFQLLDVQLLVDESVLTGESLPAEKLTGATALSGGPTVRTLRRAAADKDQGKRRLDARQHRGARGT